MKYFIITLLVVITIGSCATADSVLVIKNQ